MHRAFTAAVTPQTLRSVLGFPAFGSFSSACAICVCTYACLSCALRSGRRLSYTALVGFERVCYTFYGLFLTFTVAHLRVYANRLCCHVFARVRSYAPCYGRFAPATPPGQLWTVERRFLSFDLLRWCGFPRLLSRSAWTVDNACMYWVSRYYLPG